MKGQNIDKPKRRGKQQRGRRQRRTEYREGKEIEKSTRREEVSLLSELRDSSNRAPKLSGVARHGRLKKSTAWKTAFALIGGTLADALIASTEVAGVAVWPRKANLKPVTNATEPMPPPTHSVAMP